MNARKNAKWSVIGLGLAACLISAGNLLSSAQTDPPTPATQAESKETKPQGKTETEESVLQEKVAALKQLYDVQVAYRKAGRAPTYAIYHVGRDWKMAEAELAAVRGNRQEQIRDLEEAVKMAEMEMKSQKELLKSARTKSSDVTKAVIRRADTKLALIRAKKQNAR